MLPTTRTYRTPTLSRWPDVGTDIDRFFEGILGRPITWTERGNADLYETDDEYVLEMELPGFGGDEVDVSVERGVLAVSGMHRAEEEEEGRTYHVRERSHERFTRTFTLPQSVNADDVHADLENGILTVRLPKMAEAKPRRIEVKARK